MRCASDYACLVSQMENDESGQVGGIAASQIPSEDDSSSEASEESDLHRGTWIPVLDAGEVKGISFLQISDEEPLRFVYKDAHRNWEAPVGPDEIWLTRVEMLSSEDIAEQLEYLHLDLREGTRASHHTDGSLPSFFPDHDTLDVVITTDPIKAVDMVLGKTDEGKHLVLRPSESGPGLWSAGVGILASFEWACSQTFSGFQDGAQVALSVEKVQQINTARSGAKRSLDDTVSVSVGMTFGGSVFRSDYGETMQVEEYAVVLRSTAGRHPIAIEASLHHTLMPMDDNQHARWYASLSVRDLVQAGVYQQSYLFIRARSLIQTRAEMREPLTFHVETTPCALLRDQLLYKLAPGVPPDDADLAGEDAGSHMVLRLDECTTPFIVTEDSDCYDPQQYDGDYGIVNVSVQFVFNAGELPLRTNALACVPLVLQQGADYAVWPVFPASRAAEYELIGMVLGVFKVSVQGNAEHDKWGAYIIAQQVCTAWRALLAHPLAGLTDVLNAQVCISLDHFHRLSEHIEQESWDPPLPPAWSIKTDAGAAMLLAVLRRAYSRIQDTAFRDLALPYLHKTDTLPPPRICMKEEYLSHAQKRQRRAEDGGSIIRLLGVFYLEHDLFVSFQALLVIQPKESPELFAIGRCEDGVVGFLPLDHLELLLCSGFGPLPIKIDGNFANQVGLDQSLSWSLQLETDWTRYALASSCLGSEGKRYLVLREQELEPASGLAVRNERPSHEGSSDQDRGGGLDADLTGSTSPGAGADPSANAGGAAGGASGAGGGTREMRGTEPMNGEASGAQTASDAGATQGVALGVRSVLQSAEVGHDAAPPQQQVGCHAVHTAPCLPRPCATPCAPRLARHALRAMPYASRLARHTAHIGIRITPYTPHVA